MKTSTLEKPIVNEMLPLTEAISKQFLQLAHDHIVKPADFDNDQGLTIRDDILMLTRKPLPKELRKVLIEAGIVVDNLMYRTAGKGGIFEDNVMYKNGDKARIIEDYLMYLTAGIVEDNAMFLTSVIIRDDIMLNAVPGTKPGIFVDNLVYLYKKPTTDPLQTGNPQYIVVTGAVARIMENAKAGTVIRDDVMLRNSAQGSMIAMPIHHFGPRKNQQNLFLVAVQQNGAAAPKVGRVRA